MAIEPNAVAEEIREKLKNMNARDTWAFGPLLSRAVTALAQPASSPAGGDVREAAARICEEARPVRGHVIEFDGMQFVKIDDVNSELNKRAAEIRALSPSTSAAEPVAWTAAPTDIPTDLATRIMALPWRSCEPWTVDEQADRHGELQEMIAAALATPPAPAAVDGQRVKDGAWWDKAGARLSEDPDEAYEQVKAFTLPREVIRTRDLQRHFQIGFNRASSFIESMEGAGLISKWDAEIEGRYVIRACLATDKEGA